MNILSQLFLLVPFAVLAFLNLLPHKTAFKISLWFASAVSVFEGINALILILEMKCSPAAVYSFELFYAENSGIACHFRLRVLTLFLMLCIGVVTFTSTMVAHKTITFKRRSYTNLLMCLILGMNGMLMATDLFSLYVFLEIVGISSFVLIALYRTKDGLEGSFKYLVVSAAGVMLLLLGLSFLLMQSADLSYSAISASMLNGADNSHKALTVAAVVLMMCGFCVKAGAVPFHSWLPDAHQSADTSISVLLSGIVIKIAGIYGLIVIRSLFGSLEAVRLAFKVIGLISVIYGALLASRQEHFKRICAYSSVSQMGYIILGLSTNTTLGLVGALLHVFSHAVFKSTLFTNAAALHEQVGELEISKLGGLGKKMPVTTFSSIIAFLSTAGIPPLCGFWSKLIIILALWVSGAEAWAVAALLASILTSVYFLRLQKNVFFGETPENLESVKEIGGSVRFIEIVLTLITTLVGLAFPAVLVLLQNAGISGII